MRTPKLSILFAFALPLLACSDRRNQSDDDTPDDDDGADDDSAEADDDDSTASDDDTTGDDDDDTTPTSPCDAAITRLTNIGCEFFAVDLDNAENFIDDAAHGQFAVVVATVRDDLVAQVSVYRNDAAVGSPVQEVLQDDASVPPGGLHIFRLPARNVDGDDNVPNSDGGPQTQHSNLAWRIESDAPIVAYQFNTLDQQFSNDASLLLPTHAWGTQHVALTWPPSGPTAFLGGPANRGYITVVAVEDDTVVDVTPTHDIDDGPGVPAGAGGVGIVAGETASFTLDAYGTLNLETTLIDNPLQFPPPPVPDLSGSLVTSNRPVAVFVGTDLSMVVPEAEQYDEGHCCAEHIEQQVLPTRAMRSRFVVSRSAVRNEADPEPDVVRILAAQAGTQVTTTLPGADATFTLGAGEYRTLESTVGFTVDATGPLHVAQFLVVGTSGGGIGDSSLLPVPALEQRRADYTITTGEGFSENWVVLSMEQGAEAWVDGAAVDGTWCDGPATDGTIGGATYVAWTCPIGDGVHRVASASDPFYAEAPLGVAVYGYYSAGSYAYPGGAGLE